MLADEETASLSPILSRKIHNTLFQKYPRTVTEVAHHLTPEEKTMFSKVIQFENYINKNIFSLAVLIVLLFFVDLRFI